MRRHIPSLFVFALAFLSVVNSHAGTPHGNTEAIACAPTDSRVAAAVVDGWLWLTRNRGERWDRVVALPGSSATEAPETFGAGSTPFPEVGIIPGREEGELFTSEGEELVEAEASSGDNDQTQGASELKLAVSDGGRWALGYGDDLLLGSRDGVDGKVEVDGLRGMVFDDRGRLWMVERDRLRQVVEGAPRGSWIIPGAGAPVWGGAGDHKILIPGAEGLRVMDVSGEGVAIQLMRTGSVDGVAPVPQGGGWLLAIKGRLSRWGLQGMVEELGVLPGSISGLLVEGSGICWVVSPGGGWLEMSSGFWRPSGERVLAVDALGGLWRGTPTGPGPPGDSASVASMDIRTLPMNELISSSRTHPMGLPGPPPCIDWPLNPLPRVKIVAGYGRGDGLEYGIPVVDRTGGSRTWIYAGFALVWSLDPPEPTRCVEEQRRFRDVQGVADARLARLWIAWRKAVARLGEAGGEVEKLDARIEAERCAELIRVLSGEYPDEKE